MAAQNCETCSHTFTTTGPQRFCSGPCRAAFLASQRVTCDVCEQDFTPKAFKQRYCTPRCRDGRSRIAEYDRLRAHPKNSPLRPCSRCGGEFRGAGPRCIHCLREAKYGITRAEVAALTEAQGGTCAFCDRTQGLVLDHDHETGQVRGVLCGPCNTALGRLGDSVDGILNVLSYLLSATAVTEKEKV
jgi:hypothetical protein